MKPAASHASITLYPDVGEFDASVGMGYLKSHSSLGYTVTYDDEFPPILPCAHPTTVS
jgi:hypothetical protein